MKSGLEKEFDAYIKKTIINTVINFAKTELRKRQREIPLELLKDNFNDGSLPLNFSNKIEELFENEKLSKIVAVLPKETKTILKLSIIDNYNSKEIASIIGKSDSRVRHIIRDTLNEIKRKYEE